MIPGSEGQVLPACQAQFFACKKCMTLGPVGIMVWRIEYTHDRDEYKIDIIGGKLWELRWNRQGRS
jgi:hypothetical protein